MIVVEVVVVHEVMTLVSTLIPACKYLYYIYAHSFICALSFQWVACAVACEVAYKASLVASSARTCLSPPSPPLLQAFQDAVASRPSEVCELVVWALSMASPPPKAQSPLWLAACVLVVELLPLVFYNSSQRELY